MKTVPLLFLTLCATTAFGETKIFVSKTQDVATRSTYTWLPPRLFTKAGIVEDDPTYAPLIRQAVNRELTKKGYKEVPSGGDLQIMSAGVGVASSQLEGILITYGFAAYDGYYGPTTASPITRINHEGVLLVALVDPKTNKGIWSGYDSQALGGTDSVPKAIDKAASKLFKKLPQKK
jgi:hypothetical protein